MLADPKPPTSIRIPASVRPKVFSTTHRLIVGDARRVDSRRIQTVHLVATSPPYWTILDYGATGQIGYGESLSDYVRSLEAVWRHAVSALVPGGRLVVNVGDQYLRSTRGVAYHIIPLHAIVVNSIQKLRGANLDYLGSIVWRKVSTTRTSGGASVMGSYPFPRAVYPCFENEFIAIFRKPGTAPRPVQEVKELAKMDIDEWRDFTQGVWTIPGARSDENPASFPEAVPERLIRMFTFPGETVLDPFVGGGTTMRAAASLGRNSVGIELGFTTTSGRPFVDAIRDRVISAGSRVPYAGPASFVLA